MSEMVTVRTRKMWTCLPGTPRWIVGWQQTSAGTRKLFLADQSSHPSSAFRFASGIPVLSHWHSRGQVFPGSLERNRGSRWESCTLLSFWQLQSQRHWHGWWRSAGDRRYPKCPLLWRILLMFLLFTNHNIWSITGSYKRKFVVALLSGPTV